MPILTDSSQTPEVSCSDKRPKIIYPKTLMRQKRSALTTQQRQRPKSEASQQLIKNLPMIHDAIRIKCFFHTPHQV